MMQQRPLNQASGAQPKKCCSLGCRQLAVVMVRLISGVWQPRCAGHASPRRAKAMPTLLGARRLS